MEDDATAEHSIVLIGSGTGTGTGASGKKCGCICYHPLIERHAMFILIFGYLLLLLFIAGLFYFVYVLIVSSGQNK
jgi:hypothetical protein